jgi:hypothetical protein
MSINTLDVPARLAFNLTESPWIDGGRQYSVRVCNCAYSYLFVRLNCSASLKRTFGRTPTTARQFDALRWVMCHHTA